MSYDIENGYSPETYEDILTEFTNAVNDEVGTTYTPESIVGTNWHKYSYGGIQLVMGVENRMAQLVSKLQDYISYQNKKLILPKCSNPGLILALEQELNVVAAIMPIEQIADRGKVYVCCDVDSTAEGYSTLKQNIINALGKYTTAGAAFNGTEQGNFTALNGQQFHVAYELPQEVVINVNITVEASRNVNALIPTENNVINLFKEKFNENYRLGKDFEPETYICKDDLPWAASFKITFWTTGDQQEGVMQLNYNEKAVLGTVNATIIDE